MTSSARIVFIGAGAIGGYVGGHLCEAGYDVTLIDQWAEHVEAIKANGFHYSGTSGDHVIRVPALHVHETQTLIRRSVEITFICTKLYDTMWATDLIAPYLASDGFVVTMQNGVIEETIAKIVGWGRTVGCIASTLSAEAVEPGHVMRTRQPGGAGYTIFRVGEVHGRVTPRAESLAHMLSHVDSAKVTTNLWGERWAKLIANTMTSGLSGATGLSLRAIGTREDMRKVQVKLAAEAVRVGRALGYAIEPVMHLEPDVWVRADEGDADALRDVSHAFDAELERLTDAAYSGTAQDLRKGRRTEIDFMNGYVADKGREIGIAAPTHERITTVVKQLERSEADAAPHHAVALLG